MPLSRVYIKELPAVVGSSQLLGKLLEVEGTDASGNPKNFRLPFGLLLQTINENLVGPNHRPDLRKGVSSIQGREQLDPRWLCLGCVCYVEEENQEYILVYDPTGPLSVYREATFAGVKVPARWVALGSEEQYTSGFEEFNPLTTRYNQNDTVRYTIAGVRRLFEARQDLIRSNYTPAYIPAPTGSVSDPNWREINPAIPTLTPTQVEALVSAKVGHIPDWSQDTDYAYPQTVIYNQRLYRAKSSLFNSQRNPAADTVNWETIGGSVDSGGTQVPQGTILDDNVLISLEGITETIGGISPGNFVGTADEFLRKLLIKYQQPTFQSFTFQGQGSRTVEAGTTFTGPATFAWSVSNSQNVQPGKITIRDLSTNMVLVSNSANDGQETAAMGSYTLEVGESRQYQISTLNTQNETLSATLSITTALARYYGALSLTPAMVKAALESQNITSLGLEKDLAASLGLNRTYDCSGGKHIYYLYPAGLPAPTTVQQGPNNFSAYQVENLTIRDAFGTARLYRLLYTGYQTSSSFNLNIIA